MACGSPHPTLPCANARGAVTSAAPSQQSTKMQHCLPLGRLGSKPQRCWTGRRQCTQQHQSVPAILCRPSSQGNDSVTQTTVSTDWHEIEGQRWEGHANEPETCDLGLSPLWKVLILSDGSVTRHLQLLTGTKVHVECLAMTNIGASTEDVPPAAHVIEGPRVQRQVLLRAGPQQQPLVYACSWWNADQVDEFLSDKSQPIWISLSQGHVELYRDIQVIYHGNDKKLEQLLECEGPFWGRQYLFWHKQRPLTCIYEVFSNKLENLLGPKSSP